MQQGKNSLMAAVHDNDGGNVVMIDANDFGAYGIVTQEEVNFIYIASKLLRGYPVPEAEVDQRLERGACGYYDVARELRYGMRDSGVEGFWIIWGVYELTSHYLHLPLWRPLLTDCVLPAEETEHYVGQLLSEVHEEQVAWLWSGYIPLGKLTVIEGDPGEGKSMVTMDLAARVSTGNTMPDGSDGLGHPAGVVIISPEDDAADTLVPRLLGARANREYILALSTVKCANPDGTLYERPFNLATNLDELEKAIKMVNAKLVILDPLSALVGGHDPHKDSKIRSLLTPLALLMAKCGTCCILVRHLTKEEKHSGNDQLYRGLGSIGIIGIARSAIRIMKDPEDESARLLVPLKNSLAPACLPYAFEIITREDQRPAINWLGKSDFTFASQDSDAPPAKLGATRREILEILKTCAPESRTPKQIAEEVPEMSNKALSNLLKSMVKAGQIECKDRGMYSAKIA